MRVYYLTGAQYALSNIALDRIKVSRFQDLNDPFELLGINVGGRGQRASFYHARQKIIDAKGLICFSRAWSNPLIWGHYAEKHTGICLGFDVPDKQLKPVLYKRELLKSEINNSTPVPSPTPKIMAQLLRTKFIDWEYENELRMFIDLKKMTAESGLFFQQFSKDLELREVILGPRCEIPIAGVRAMVSKFDPSVYVVKSRIAFTRYKVVESKSETRVKSA